MALSQQIRNWSIAVRPFAYPASIVPVVLGSAYAWYVLGQFNWLHFVLALVAGMLYHSGCNLVNDYFDYKYEVDREGTYGSSGMLVSGAMQPAQIARGAVVTLVLGTLIGLYFIWYFHSQAAVTYPFAWPLLAIGAAGLLATVFYTATPANAKYNALGTVLVFLMMGPAMVLGGYFIQAGTLSWPAVWLSLPVGFTVAAILQANDTRDILDDRQAGITTLSTLFGPIGARGLYTFLLVAPYLTLIALVLLHVAPWPVLAGLLTIPLAAKLLKLFWSVRDERHAQLAMTDAMTAQLHMALGMLLSLGVVVGHWFH
jgi:1,4-dihydroxy-2-naphthoate octaprenyltransferase